jgi:tellurite methyltransferase
MNRPITGFHQDDESHWVAELVCGHGQHTRHDPPLSERPWVLTPEGRAERVGLALDCVACDRREMPAGHRAYRRTPAFTEDSVPKALLAAHTTKAGVWALIHVSRGELAYRVHAPFDEQEVLTAVAPGVVLPEVLHEVKPLGPVAFFVQFWKARGGSAG